MTPSLWLRDVASYSLQLALLIGAAGLLARLLPLRPAGFALAYWRALLLACLLLPIAQPWSQPQPVSLETRVAGTSPTAPASAPAAPARAFSFWPSARVVLWTLGAGVAARAAWLLLGFWSLGRLRRSGRRLEGDLPPFADAQARLGVRAEFYTSEETDVPITFGLRRPAVLLPEAVLAMDRNAQQAILCHELLHVRRRDWLYAVLEECVRALLWFHPAVAWLVGRIHLSREQAVDSAVIAITESREDYVGALLAVARARPRRELVAATLFLRKGRLKQRLAEILEEGTMSKKRAITHLLASGCAVLLAAGAAVRLFPLEARASETAPIQVLRGGEHLLHRANLEYPRRAIERGVFGDVLLELSLDDTGQVQDARVLSGPDELRAAALRSVLRWHYGPPAPIPGTLQVLLQFTLPAEPLEPEKKERPDGPENVARQIEELRKALEDPGVPDERRARYEHQLAERQAHLMEIEHGKRRLEQELLASDSEMRRMEEKLKAAAWQSREAEERLKKELAEEKRFVAKLRSANEARPLEGRLSAIHAALPPETVKALLPQLGVSVGDPIDAAVIERVRAAVARFDEHIRVSLERPHNGGLILLLVGPEQR